MVSIEEAKRKWRDNLSAAIPLWLTEVTKASSYDDFVRSIAAFLGVSESVVRSSVKGDNWRAFQSDVSANPGAYRAKLEAIATPAKAEQWFDAFRSAFTTPKK